MPIAEDHGIVVSPLATMDASHVMIDPDDFRFILRLKPVQYFTLFWSIVGLMGGIAGFVDTLVEWRDSVEPMVDLYVSARDGLLALLPFVSLPTWVGDYLIIGSAFGMSYRMVVWMSDGDLMLDYIIWIRIVILWPLILILAIACEHERLKHTGNVWSKFRFDYNYGWILLAYRYILVWFILTVLAQSILLFIAVDWNRTW